MPGGSATRQIYEQAVLDGFINLDQASEIAGYSQARMALWRLSKRGQLLKVKEGLYAGIPPGFYGTDYEVDRYLMASLLGGPGSCLAFHSALELHGVAQSAFYHVTYLTEKRMRPYEFQRIRYVPVAAGDVFGTMKVRRTAGQVRVTDKERTFLDCLRRQDLCGGYEEFFKSADGFRRLSGDRLWEYLLRFDEKPLFNRLGFTLARLMDVIEFDESLLSRIRDRISGRPVRLIPDGRSDEILVPEWNIMAPTNLEEMLRYV